jgi:hypothetical protein
MFPETSSLVGMVAFRMIVFPTTALVMLAVAAMVTFVTLATGMVAVPVRVALLMGALSKFRESSAFLRSIIS